jgi:hypothetical protein
MLYENVMEFYVSKNCKVSKSFFFVHRMKYALKTFGCFIFELFESSQPTNRALSNVSLLFYLFINFNV